MIDLETEHLMTRAKEEAVLAIQARHPAAARAHQNMAIRYSTRAVMGLVEEEFDPIESELLPQPAVPAQ